MFLLSRTVVDDLLFLFRQFAERDVCAHTHFPAHVYHDGPHQGIPGGNGAVLDGQCVVRYECGAVHSPNGSRAVAGAAGALAVESELFRGRRIETGAALRTDQLLTCRNSQRGRVIVPIRAAVAGKPGIHQAEAVEKLGPCAECAADAGDSRALMERKSSRNIQNVVHISFCRLSHAPPCIGGEGIQISPGPLRVKDAQSQGGLAGAGYTGDADDLPQRDVHVYVFQVVDPRAADQHFIDHMLSFHRAMELLPPAHT